MASSTQLNEMPRVGQEILNGDVDTIPANSNIPSPLRITQETGMNGLPSSESGFCQRSNQATETENNTHTTGYKKRSTLSTIENKQLEDMKRNLQRFKGISRIFEGPLIQLKEWPSYFKDKEAAGHAIQKGFLNLWSTFIIAETLLAGIAIQPFVSNVPNMSGWQLEVYGGLWTLALLLDFLGLVITALFLGYLLGNPSELAWVWVCKIGPLIGIPAILVLLDTLWGLIAISFSSWVIYGPRVGIMCAVVAVFVVAASVAISNSFVKASKELEALLKLSPKVQGVPMSGKCHLEACPNLVCLVCGHQMETLLAGIAIQPFVSNASNMSRWQLEVYGGLWTLALLLDFLGLGITALFLATLLGNPSHLAWVWVCKIGPFISLPGILVLLDTIWSLIAISFSSWVIYGPRVGIIGTVVAVLTFTTSVAISKSFAKVSKENAALP